MAEGANPDVAITGNPESRTRCSDDVGLLENLCKGIPGGLAGEGDPNVGGVVAAESFVPEVVKALLQQGSVLLVVGDHVEHGGVALVRAAGQPAGLRDAGGAVVARGHHAVPVLLHREPVRELQLRRHNRPGEAHAGEAGELGEGAGLEGHFPGAWDLEDALGHVGVVDEDGVGSIEHDDGPVLLRERHQLRELLPGCRRTSRVVGRAEEDEVGAGGVLQVGEEPVLGSALEVRDVVKLLRLRIVRASVTSHHAGVHVGRVCGILHRHGESLPEHGLHA
mmetsp:Transcript_7261/g.12553  ORF Transcript_7261/g.12553 Transcript_7261/m.12553 type:complete len:279 (-) Transcript_7261:553-1389(-)